MKPLKFKVLGERLNDKLEDFELEMNFVGTADDEKIASSLITHLMTGNLIVGIDFNDIQRILGKKTNQLFVYEFSLLFEQDRLAKRVKGKESMVYGVYGEYDVLDMRLFSSIERILWDNTKISTGAPILPESIGVAPDKNNKIIKVVALYN